MNESALDKLKRKMKEKRLRQLGKNKWGKKKKKTS
jgi:hypothetical protein